MLLAVQSNTQTDKSNIRLHAINIESHSSQYHTSNANFDFFEEIYLKNNTSISTSTYDCTTQ